MAPRWLVASCPARAAPTSKEFPIFDTVEQARKSTGANATVIYVPPPLPPTRSSRRSQPESNWSFVSPRAFRCSTWSRSNATCAARSSRLIGPNCPGVITPGECKIGIMPGYIHKPGDIGVVSRSGTLTYEAVYQLTQLGIGQSSCVGNRRRPDYRHAAISTRCKMFNEDPAPRCYHDWRNRRHGRGRGGAIHQGKL